MKNIEEVVQVWKQTESNYQKVNLQAEKLTQMLRTDRIGTKMSRLTRLKVLKMSFYMVFGCYSLWFATAHFREIHLCVSGFLLAIWSLAFAYTAMDELKTLRAVDYNAPTSKLQQQLLKVRTSIINAFRFATWAFPLHLPFIFVLGKLLFGLDLLVYVSPIWLMVQLAITFVVMIPLAFWASKKLVPENAGKKWMKGLLKGNGSQIEESLMILKELGT